MNARHVYTFLRFASYMFGFFRYCNLEAANKPFGNHTYQTNLSSWNISFTLVRAYAFFLRLHSVVYRTTLTCLCPGVPTS